MPNQITTPGLETKTQSELVTQFTSDFQAIYGADINLDSDTPDGQMMNIFIQAVLDNLDLMTQVYNSFDPDSAFGVTLDARVAYNGIQRQAGTHTVTNVSLTITGSVNLYGLDQTTQPVFTVADNAGTQWELITTALGATSGVYIFQAANPGAVQSLPNTITVPVTIVLGVTAINNPTTFTSLGVNEETDAALKIRRQKAVALSSSSFNSSLLSALENTEGVTSAFIYENDSDAVDVDGVPGHSIWVIVSGSAAAADIANAIYLKRNAGCGMFGAQSYTITQLDGSSFIVKWDNVAPLALFLRATLTSIDGETAPDIAAIRAAIPLTFVPEVSAQVNINEIVNAISDADPNALVTSPGFSLTSGGVYSNTLAPTAKNNQFTIVPADVILLPMQMSCAGAVVSVVASVVTVALTVAAAGPNVTFTGLGGFQPNTFDMVSGTGSVVAGTGVYTPRNTPGTDVVRVTDAQGHTAICTVTAV